MELREATVTTSWPFADSPTTAVITLRQIIEQGHTIRYVSHDQDDGAWQFLNGEDINTDDARVVALREYSSAIRRLQNWPICHLAAMLGAAQQPNRGSVATDKAPTRNGQNNAGTNFRFSIDAMYFLKNEYICLGNPWYTSATI
jgi:hypothetical protein